MSKKIHVSTLHHEYITRGKDHTYLLPRCKKSIGQRSYTYLAPKILNVVPDHLKNIKSIGKFKKRIKAWLTGETREIINNTINNN